MNKTSMGKRILSLALSLSMVLSLLFGGISWAGFQTLSAGAAEAPVNLALGKKVTASGTEVDDGRWTPDKVVDGAVSKESRWSSNKADDAWIYVDLGAAYEIDRVVLSWELRAREFSLQLSLDGEDWTTVHTQRDETSATAKTDTIEFESQTAQYVKMQGIERSPLGDGRIYGYSMYEFEIYQTYDPQGNLAYQRPVVVSGNEVSDGRFAPELMVDGFVSAASRWSSNKADDAWCYVDLGEVYDINRVVLNWQLRAIGYRVEVSTDGENWNVVYSTLVNSGAQSKVDDLTFDTVRARYVKMQGIERYPVGDTKYGYSLYEFEVYEDTHSSSLTEQQAAEEVLNGLQVPSAVYKDFTLQTKGVKYTTVAWESSDPAILSVEGGAVTVIHPEERTTVQLTATVTCGEVVLTESYPVVVRAISEIPVEYNIYPVVQQFALGENNFVPSERLNVVVGDAVDEATRAYLQEIFAQYGIDAQYTGQAEAGTTSLLLGVAGTGDAADLYCAGYTEQRELLAQQKDAYLLNIAAQDAGVIALLGNSADAVFYGVATLDQIFAANTQKMSELTITDWPDSQFRGFIEGFYGTPWSHEDRQSLMDFGKRFKMNAYIYGPKDDAYHRNKWRELYPDAELAQLKELIEKGRETKVEFVWAIHPGLDIDLSNPAEYDKVVAKFEQLYDAGVRQFGFFMDDIDSTKAHDTRGELVAMLNKLETEFVAAKGDVKPLVFVPTFYSKGAANNSKGLAYLEALKGLDENIEIMWTGDGTMSSITADTLQWIYDVVGRDIFIWWNFPVNDYCTDKLLLGPSGVLGNDVQHMSGLVSNPMNQAEASKVSLFSVADYTWNLGAYNQDQSWHDSFDYITPELADAFRTLATHACSGSGGSLVNAGESSNLVEPFATFIDGLQNGEVSKENAGALNTEFQKIIDACDTLLTSDANPNLSDEVAGWAHELKQLAKAGSKAVETALVATAENKDPETVWNAYSAASAALLNTGVFPTVPGGGTMAKAGTVRIRPFVENVLSILHDQVKAAVLAGADTLPDTVAVYTNVAALQGLLPASDGQTVSVVPDGEITLAPGEYLGVRLSTLHKLYNVAVQGAPAEAVLEVSRNGIDWTAVEGNGRGATAKYVRLVNAGTEPLRFTLSQFDVVQLENIDQINVTLGSSMKFYQTYTADKMLDGDLDTWMWQGQAQKAGQTITFDFGKPITLYEMAFYMRKGDEIQAADVEISTNNSAWTKVGEIVKGGEATGYVTNLEVGGKQARYVRIRLTKDFTQWIKLYEVSFNGVMGASGSLAVQSTSGGAVFAACDDNLRTSYAPEDASGVLTYTNSDYRGATELIVLQNGDKISNAAVEIVSELGVKSAGKLDKACNRINISHFGYVYEIRIRWENGAAPEIFEIATASREVPPPAETPVLSGIENGASTRGSVRILANKKVTWVVNDVALDRQGNNLLLSTEGSYTVYARSDDGGVSETLRFAIDRTGPVLGSEQVETNGSTNQDVVVRADEDARFELDGVTIEDFSRELTVTEPGRHVVRAYDKAGNRSAAFVFTIEKSVPILSTNFYILNGVTRYNVAVTADRRVDYYVNGALVAENEYRCKFTEPGVYEVKAVDAAGNESKTLKFEIRR